MVYLTLTTKWFELCWAFLPVAKGILHHLHPHSKMVSEFSREVVKLGRRTRHSEKKSRALERPRRPDHVR